MASAANMANGGKQVVVLVGTNKGAFVFHADAERRAWRRTGPHLGGWEVYSLLGLADNARHAPRLLAATSHMAYGATIRVSDDLGETWKQMPGSPRYAGTSGSVVKRIWHLARGAPSQPDTLYAGVEDAGLFVSHDRGESWQELGGLTRHPTRPYWQPGGGGLCLHSIAVDPGHPRRLWVGISAAGVFRSDDGGQTWTVCNDGLPPAPAGHPYPEVGRCVHKLALDPRDADTLYVQQHGGVYKSTNGGRSWTRIEQGLPSAFGFPIAVTPTGDLFVVPLEGDEARYMVEGKLRVYRSRDGGQTWAATGSGLPQHPSYVSVLRDALAVDSLDPPGIYFGTTAGELFSSTDAGDTWQALPGKYSRIMAVQAWAFK
ncbi:MAG: WD40/YVTN/BNR-like repeat-containing protein, partial [Chloroflexota bacterium]